MSDWEYAPNHVLVEVREGLRACVMQVQGVGQVNEATDAVLVHVAEAVNDDPSLITREDFNRDCRGIAQRCIEAADSDWPVSVATLLG